MGTTLTKVEQTQRLYAELVKQRESWKTHWRDLSDYISPRTSRFLTTDRNDGKKKHNNIIDSTATFAARTLASGMMSGITSPSRPWFRLAMPDPDLNEFGSVRVWLDTVEQRMRDVFLKSNLYTHLPRMYSGLGVYGTSALGIFSDLDDTIRAMAYPLGSYVLSGNDKGVVDCFMREFSMTVRQIVEKFGLENVSTSVRNQWDRSNYETWIDVVHSIMPNLDHVDGALEARRFAWGSTYFEKATKNDETLSESGFNEFPIMAPRWDVTGEDVYGMSPAMDVLGDVKALQLLQKQKSKAIEKQINPPLSAPAEMANNAISTLPGAINYENRATSQGGLRPVYEVTFDIGGTQLETQEMQMRIRRAFYEDLFLMLASDPRTQPPTAREIQERHEEKLLMLGPVLERLNDEALDPLIDRTFSLMLRRGDIPEPPPEIQGQELKVEYVSILAQAQKLVGIGSVDRFVGYIANVSQFWPEALDKFDIDKSIDDYGEMLGVSADLILDEDVVQEKRDARAAEQQAMQEAAIAREAVTAQKEMSETDTAGQNALTDARAAVLGSQNIAGVV